jgi:SAM-dependent methyltransferase
MNRSSPLVVDSPFWRPLWRAYWRAPSIALCRVPELEYASSLSFQGRSLDHCCGDGQFARLAWPRLTFTVGCDINPTSIHAARHSRKYDQLDLCDAGKVLPYPAGFFDFVFNNSALEHIADLRGALAEIARVTRAGGLFAFNVLNHRYFDWWPLDPGTARSYREWQPFYHALSLEEWTTILASVDLLVQDIHGYFDEEASRVLARLDYEFSGYYLRQQSSPLVNGYFGLCGIRRMGWRKKLGRLNWRTNPDSGSGYFITARKQ